MGTTLDADLIRRHYEGASSANEIVERVSRQIDAMGEGHLLAAQTAALDQFHIRGLVATAELAQFAGATKAMRVLDAGSGLGGPSRYLAESLGCDVVGVDLTPSYVTLARHMARRSTAADRLRYEVGDLLEMAAEDSHFDLVWTQHTMMNVRDRRAAYAEFHRVLRAGGKLACYDIVAADTKPEILLPAPWATVREASHLLTTRETVDAVTRSGFDLVDWIDVTRLALNWFGQPMVHDPALLSLGSVVGPRIQLLAANLSRNLREGRVGVAMGVFVRSTA